MNITIKNVKYAAFASQETHCFKATLYVDGKPFGYVSNDGHGGCDDVYPLNNCKKEDIPKWRKRLDAIEKELGKEKHECSFNDPKTGKPAMLDNDLEMVVGGLMNDWHRMNEVKKILRRISYIRDGKVYQMPAKYKPTAAAIQQIQAAKFWKKDNVLLNVGGKNEAATAKARLDQIGYFGE